MARTYKILLNNMVDIPTSGLYFSGGNVAPGISLCSYELQDVASRPCRAIPAERDTILIF